jgi:flavin-dependent dehydrogenase
VRSALDVIIVGAGPAGAIAALVLCRAGARVAIFDRARFPRDKLCGDTVNPGTLALLGRLGVASAAGGFPIHGMVVTGERGVRIAGRYPEGMSGRAVLRRDLDHALLAAAAAAGARIEEGTLVRGTARSATAIDGVYVAGRDGTPVRVGAPVVIAADGRQSHLARSLRLGRHPPSPRRWAVGAYFTDVAGPTECGEMHIRPRKYVGVAALPAGLTNACVVTADRSAVRDPRALLMETLSTEPELRERFATARLTGPPSILGPLAVECTAAGAPGLLLAGDAAGFIDPMTGDGLRFAVRGGELAALEALRAIEHGFGDAHLRLQAARSREFRVKWWFDRALRRLAGSPSAVRLAAAAATVMPSWVEHAIRYAGDVRGNGDTQRFAKSDTEASPKLEERRRT